MENVKVGVDIGGSHIGIGIVNNNIEIIDQYEKDFTINEKKDILNVAVNYLDTTLKKIRNKYNFSKVGIGIPGTISNGIILKSVNLGIYNYDIKKELEYITGLEINVKNDCKCACIAEYNVSNDLKEKNVLFLTLGTGIGGAYIHKGNLLQGKMYEGYEFGHIIIDPNGIECKCGKKGCFEKYGSILAFKNKVIEELDLSYDISGPELRGKIRENENKITKIKEEYLNYLVIGLSNLINIFEPDITVIGGGFARYDYMLLNDLKSKIINSKYLFNERKSIMIRTAKLGNDAGIIGASLL